MADSAGSADIPPPGWYPDAAGQLRWWDGRYWGQVQQQQQPSPRTQASAPPGLAFNPPPGWPAPPAGWQPPAGWRPDPSWPPAPTNWQFWVPGPGSARPAGAAGAAARPLSLGLSREELSTALGILFPVRAWLHDRGWRQGIRLLVIAYALLPLIFLAVLDNSSSLSTPGWAYSLYVAPLWTVGFWLLIRPGQIGRREIWIGVGVIIWTFVWLSIVTVHINGLLGHPPLSLPAALVVGVNEETTKALPVIAAGLVMLRRYQTKLSVRMCMFMGTIAGLTFGVTEQAFYTSNFIVLINKARSISQADFAVLAFAERVFVDGFQHAVWAGIAGFFIGMALNYRRRRVQLMVLGVAVAAVLHALNDWLAPSIFLAIVVQAASLLLFLGYTMRAESIERQVRTSPIFRGESMLLDASDLTFDQPRPG